MIDETKLEESMSEEINKRIRVIKTVDLKSFSDYDLCKIVVCLVNSLHKDTTEAELRIDLIMYITICLKLINKP